MAFFDAATHLYKSRSVSRWVGRWVGGSFGGSVGRSVGRSVTLCFYSVFKRRYLIDLTLAFYGFDFFSGSFL